MNGPEIRDLIAKNDLIIRENAGKGTFILNKEVRLAIAANEALRKICPHEYENGRCIYCGSEEK